MTCWDFDVIFPCSLRAGNGIVDGSHMIFSFFLFFFKSRMRNDFNFLCFHLNSKK
jgi:hypothetical protein